MQVTYISNGRMYLVFVLSNQINTEKHHDYLYLFSGFHLSRSYVICRGIIYLADIDCSAYAIKLKCRSEQAPQSKGSDPFPHKPHLTFETASLIFPI